MGLHLRARISKGVETDAWYTSLSASEVYQEALEKAFVKWAEDLQSDADVEALRAALDRGDVALVMSHLKWDEANQEFENVLQEELAKVIEKAGGAQYMALQLQGSFTLLNPYSVEWLRTHSGAAISGITVETKKAIQEMVARSFENGIPPKQIARELRALIGPNSRQMGTLGKMRALWASEGMSDAKILELLQKAAAKMVRERALMIARTEIINAHARGSLQSWMVAKDAGLLSAYTVKEWIATPGSDRTCDICMGLHGKKAFLEGMFVGGGVTVDAPTAHPLCRCAMGLVTLDPSQFETLLRSGEIGKRYAISPRACLGYSPIHKALSSPLTLRRPFNR